MGTIQTINFSEARAKFKDVLDTVIEDEVTYVVTSIYRRSVVILSVPEYNGLGETLHLLSSNANAARLRSAVLDVAANRCAVASFAPRTGSLLCDRAIRFTPGALEDWAWWERADSIGRARLKRILEKLNGLQRAYLLERSVPLGRELAGFRTMVIQGNHRFVFRLDDDDVIAIQCKFHHGNGLGVNGSGYGSGTPS